MTRLITCAISFVAGGAIGALISHVITKEKMLNRSQERLNVMHEYYEERFGHVDIPQELLVADETKVKDETETSDIINTTRSQEPIVRATPIEEYVDYTKYYNSQVDPAENESPSDDIPEDDEALELASQGEWITREAKIEHAANKNRSPKIIRAEECGNDPTYRVIYLTYCTEDGSLVEDQGDVFYDEDDIGIVGDMIGDALDKYGFRNNDESVIYVRNFAYMVDYEITKFDGSYADLVGEGDR